MTVRLALVLTLFAAPAFAQPAPASDDMAAFEKDLDALFVHGGLTADAAAARAGAASPAVRRRNAEVDAAMATAKTAELARVPQIGAKASYTRLSYIAPVIFPFGGMNFVIPFLQDAYLTEGSIALPVSDYFYRIPKSIEGARLGADVARVNKRAAEVSAGEDARLAYYEWVRARLQVLVAQRQLAQVQATLKQVRALAEVQRLSRADLLRVESQEAQAEQTLDQLNNASALREEQLRLAIGARDDERLAIGEDIRQDLPAPAAAALDDLMKHAEDRRLELRVIDAGIAAKDKQREAETANYAPHLSAFATADYADPNQRIFPQKDEWKFTWQAGVQVSWTLNDALVAQANEHRIRAEASELRADRENLSRGTRIEVLAAMQSVQIAVHALQTSQKGLVAAEEGYRVRKELLAAERATAVELVDAETDLTRARITALDARVDLRVALAQLAHALGDDAK
jgi:outer membrane protein TolC